MLYVVLKGHMAMTSKMATIDCEFVTDSMIRGYHIFRTIWDAVIGKSLQCVQEVGNVEDRYAVAIQRGDTVVGHLPQKISTLCSLFIKHGSTINCTISGHCRYLRNLPQGGLEVPCRLHFTRTPNEVKELKLYFDQKTSSSNNTEMMPPEVPYHLISRRPAAVKQKW